MQGSHLLYPTRGFVVNENPKSCVSRSNSPHNSEPSGQFSLAGAHTRMRLKALEEIGGWARAGGGKACRGSLNCGGIRTRWGQLAGFVWVNNLPNNEYETLGTNALNVHSPL
jgi:hypothetical protein